MPFLVYIILSSFSAASWVNSPLHAALAYWAHWCSSVMWGQRSSFGPLTVQFSLGRPWTQRQTSLQKGKIIVCADVFLCVTLKDLMTGAKKEVRGLFTWPALIKELYNTLLSSGPRLVMQPSCRRAKTRAAQSLSSNHHKESFHEDAHLFECRTHSVHLMTVEVSWTLAELAPLPKLSTDTFDQL